jgi:hypothetical protein
MPARIFELAAPNAFFKQKLYGRNKKAVLGIIKTHKTHQSKQASVLNGAPSEVPRIFLCPFDSAMKYLKVLLILNIFKRLSCLHTQECGR